MEPKEPRRERYEEKKGLKSSKDEEEEAKRDLEVELEWKAKRNEVNMGKICVSRDAAARRICNGLKINYMNMRDATTGKILWQSGTWGADIYIREQIAHIPAEILACSAVSREINFTSKELINQFRLEQRIFFDGSCLEEWIFPFGFVIPQSTNTWQQTIESAGDGEMLPAELISGKLTIETAFYDGDLFISKTLVRIFYDK